MTLEVQDPPAGPNTFETRRLAQCARDASVALLTARTPQAAGRSFGEFVSYLSAAVEAADAEVAYFEAQPVPGEHTLVGGRLDLNEDRLAAGFARSNRSQVLACAAQALSIVEMVGLKVDEVDLEVVRAAARRAAVEQATARGDRRRRGR